MTFLEWLADELKKTDDEMIEIGFGEEVTLDEVFEESGDE